VQKNEIKCRSQAEAHEQEQKKGEEPLAQDYQEAFFLFSWSLPSFFNGFFSVLSGRHKISNRHPKSGL